MNIKYKKRFGGKKHVMVRIYVQYAEHMIKDIQDAIECGASGVILMRYNNDPVLWLEKYLEVAQKVFPGFWIGLGYGPIISTKDALVLFPKTAAGLWLEGNQIASCVNNTELFKYMHSGHNSTESMMLGGFKFVYEGSGAIKLGNLDAVTKRACECFDLVTVDGKSPAAPVPIKHLNKIRNAAGRYPIALMSGITSRNAIGYKDLADVFFVSSGNSYHIKHGVNKEEVIRIMAVLHNFVEV